MKLIEANILDVTSGVIFHQVNCYGVMAAGVAKAIADKYPNVLENYKLFIKKVGRKESLGRALMVKIPGKELWIANIFGQFSMGGGLQTNYEAVDQAFKEVAAYILPGTPLYFPEYMGCGLAGGSIEVYHKLIESNFKGNVHLVRYTPPANSYEQH